MKKASLVLSCIIAVVFACTYFLSDGFNGKNLDVSAANIPSVVKGTVYDCAAQSEIPQIECEALVALYNATNGASWYRHSGWLVTNTPCSWYGVTCAGGHVTHLNLSSDNLLGSIPVALGNLTGLNHLELNENQLSGSIPSGLGNLTNLQWFDLTSNQLSGTIPVALGNLDNLLRLSLWGNQLTGTIPPELGSLANLTVLYLSDNQLSGSIPVELGNLTNLTDLYLSDNQLSGSIPSELGGMAALISLRLDNNQLSGSIPDELGNLVHLQYLLLENNLLTSSIPPELGNMTILTSLELGNNQLIGSIPPQLGGLTNLRWLDLNNNQLTGNIPSALGNLGNLLVLDLWHNQLTGGIPPELGSLTNLQSLNLNNNKLTGSIPAALGSLGNLMGLLLLDNQLTGSIPPELGNLVNVIWLKLSSNQLSGSLPMSFINLISLEYFYYNDTYLCAPADDAFQTWLAAIHNLAGTGITCSNTFTSCTDLTQFPQTECEALEALYIETDGGNWTNHTDWLQTNNPCSWYGVTCDGDFDLVTHLGLSTNNLSGSIPAALGNLTGLNHLELNENQLTGGIPPELGSLTNLTILYLSNNQLAGTIPAVLGSLINLIELNMSDNYLTGSIPPELGSLTNLTLLRLNNNQLSGSLPMSFTNLTLLENFYYNDTYLCAPNDVGFQSWLSGIATLFGTTTCFATAPILISPIDTDKILEAKPTLNWVDAGEGATYEVMVSRYPSFSWNIYHFYSLTTNSVALPGLNPKLFYWKVRAQDPLGDWTPWSEVWSFTVLPQPPLLNAPPNNSFTKDTTPSFYWNPSVGATGFMFEIDDSSTFTVPILFASPIQAASNLTLVTPLIQKSYWWRVKACNAASECGKWGNIRRLTIDTTPPGKPILLTPLNNSSSVIQPPTFTWTAAVGASKYELMVDNSSGFGSPEYTSAVIATTSFTLPSALPPMAYYWKVRAIDAAGNKSVWSTVWKVTLLP